MLANLKIKRLPPKQAYRLSIFIVRYFCWNKYSGWGRPVLASIMPLTTPREKDACFAFANAFSPSMILAIINFSHDSKKVISLSKKSNRVSAFVPFWETLLRAAILDSIYFPKSSMNFSLDMIIWC